MNRAFLSLGSNLGDARGWLRMAVDCLARPAEIRLLARSALYRSEPWGYTEQPWFYNAALAVETDLAPLELLDFCQKLELVAGRELSIHWGPRTLDIDIISIDGIVMDTQRLILPHPHYRERRFVLQPLSDLLDGPAPPPLKDIGVLLAQCPARPLVERVCAAEDW